MIRISPNAVGDAKIIKLAVRFGSAIKLYFQVGNDSLVEFIIWDVAGQAKFQTMRKHFYQSADAQLLIFDLTRPKSFQNVSSWHQDIKEHLGDNIPGLIIANKKDLINDRNVSKEEIKNLEKKLNVKGVETSALTGENVDEAFLKLTKNLIKGN